jgi:HSP20 family protein
VVARRKTMAQTRWDPFEGISSLRREINRLLEDFLEGGMSRSKSEGPMEPAVEVCDTSEAIVVRVQVPGVRREDLRLTVSGDTLTVQGEIKAAQDAEHNTLYQREFRYGTFSRSIALPATVWAEGSTAQLKEGILTVTLPKSAQGHAQEIPVQG